MEVRNFMGYEVVHALNEVESSNSRVQILTFGFQSLNWKTV